MRPGEPPSFEVANKFLIIYFLLQIRYDLSDVGRVKLNNKLHFNVVIKLQFYVNDDIVAIIKHMLDLRDGKGEVDDIDHLGNRE